MSISTLDGWIAAAKQRVSYDKTASRTTVVSGTNSPWFSMFELAGSAGAGTLAIGNTANGLVHTDATAGYPIINAFGGAATGYLGRAFISNTVQSRLRFFDRLFAAGAYAFNAATTLATQPAYSSRLPSGPDYNNLEIWVEQVTAATGNQAVAVAYMNQAGVTAHNTGAVGMGAAPTVGRCWQLPLQAGDSGVQKIESVTGSVATVGTFNVMVLRPLFDAWVSAVSEGRIYDLLSTGMPQVFTDSAIYCLVNAPAGTTGGLPYCDLDIVNA